MSASAQSVADAVARIESLERTLTTTLERVGAAEGSIQGLVTEATLQQYVQEKAAPSSLSEDLLREAAKWTESTKLVERFEELEKNLTQEFKVLQMTVSGFHEDVTKKVNKAVDKGNTSQAALRASVAKLEAASLAAMAGEAAASGAAEGSGSSASGAVGVATQAGAQESATGTSDSKTTAAAEEKGEDALLHTGWRAPAAGAPETFDLRTLVKSEKEKEKERVNVYEHKSFRERVAK